MQILYAIIWALLTAGLASGGYLLLAGLKVAGASGDPTRSGLLLQAGLALGFTVIWIAVSLTVFMTVVLR